VELEILDVELAGMRCHTRIPFRFGGATLVSAPVLVARVCAQVAGEEQIGFASDLTVPKWFEKDATKSAGDDVRALFASAQRAAAAYRGLAGTPFEIWQSAYARCIRGDLTSGVALLDGFGAALVERAMIDAACRAAGVSFRDALVSDLLGFDAGALLAEASGLRSRDLVSSPAPERVLVRHTIGGLDPLRSDEVPDALRNEDDHPVALEEDIRRFGLRAFKLKTSGDPAADARRLAAIARVVGEHAPRDPLFTLDANESYADLAQVGALLDLLERDPDGRLVLEGLAYLEQPLPRARTLDPSTTQAVRALAARVPLLIDEADDSIDAFRRALDIGYRGSRSRTARASSAPWPTVPSVSRAARAASRRVRI
jgi:hypothetical protein